MLTRTSSRTGLAIAVALLTTATAGAATVDREFTESFDVAPGAVLELFHDDGDVQIEAWDEDRLEIYVRYHVVARGIGGPKDFEVDFDHSGDTIRIEGREIGGSFSFGSTRTYEHSYTVKAPPYVALELRGDDGDIAVKGWEAAIDLRANDGDVRIDGLRGSLTIELDDGDVELYDCDVDHASLRLEDGDVTLRRGSGDWKFTLDDGDLDLRRLAAGTLEASTSDGDIDISLLPAANLDARIRTDDGDVDIAVAPGVGARFTIRVDDGDMSLSGTDLTVDSKGDHGASGRIGDGSGAIEIRTNDGDVTLRDSP